jgi:hypothetical protein
MFAFLTDFLLALRLYAKEVNNQALRLLKHMTASAQLQARIHLTKEHHVH